MVGIGGWRRLLGEGGSDSGLFVCLFFFFLGGGGGVRGTGWFGEEAGQFGGARGRTVILCIWYTYPHKVYVTLTANLI